MSSTTVATPTSDDTFLMQAPGEEEAAAGDNRRTAKIAAIGGGAVVVLAAAYFLVFHHSAAGPVAQPLQLPQHHTQSAPAAPTAPVTLPKTTTAKPGRDPFKPLVVAPLAAAPITQSTVPSIPTGSTGGTGSGTTATGAGTGGNPTVVVPTGTGTGTGSGTTAAAVSGTPQWIELLSVKNGTATFAVGYTHGTAQFHVTPTSKDENPMFGSAAAGMPNFFQLVTEVDSSEVDVQYGDSTPFPLTPNHTHVLS